ncbi:MAG TPA: SprT-like domain-containing protein [Candidatus Udaeobacter sp.]|jgi:predicted SprT family Zn-dependent metalloprotease|nr:SprT-like domain-containing protein [Candidatus Udaeobacter sp.]
MPLLRQLEFAFEPFDKRVVTLGQAHRLPTVAMATQAVALQRRGRDAKLEEIARDLLCSLGAARIARELRVEWNSRFKTAAGRADYRQKLILLNPRLLEYPAEIDRTLRHELAHIVAQFRAGRRKILAHGDEWRDACCDLGIADEKRCHNLPFPVSQRPRRYLYKCPKCQREFPRARRLKRTVACLDCCRAYNGGEFDLRFRLNLIKHNNAVIPSASEGPHAR